MLGNDIYRSTSIYLRGPGDEDNDCQDEFERDFQYIHGQYDSAIIGSAIGFGAEVLTGNGLSVIIGSSLSFWAVARALYKVSVAIDIYNDCMRERGGLPVPPAMPGGAN